MRHGGTLAGTPVCVLLAALVGMAAPAAAAAGEAVAIGGRETLVVQLPPGLPIAAYENNGYRLVLDGDEAEVVVDAEPIGTTTPFVLPASLPPGAVGTLARAVTIGAETRYAAVSRILGWVSRNVEYTLDRSSPQDPASVLERRTGYCTGVARLTVALLGAVGIEAREVPGLVVGGTDTKARYHRWIEVQYPDRGWVFSDPLTAHHHVPATYLRLAGESVPANHAPPLLLEHHEPLLAVDVYREAAPGVRARKNIDDQLAGALRVQVGSPLAGTAVLEGGGLRRTVALDHGTSTFLGLEPGDYRLRLLLPGLQPIEQAIVLPGRVRRAVVFRLAAQEDSGRVPSGR